MTVNKDYMNCLLDSQIKSDDADAFGHRHFATALESLIESPQSEPPYTIGLLGKWGTGKSSIKQLYLQPLEDARKRADEAAKQKSRRLKISNALYSILRKKVMVETPTREERIYCITFNAWRFGGENIKRALLRDVFIKLGGDESRINDALFRQIQRQETESRSFSAMLREAYDKWLWTLMQVVIVFGCIIGGLFLIKGQFAATAEWLSGAFVTLCALAGAAAIKALLDPQRFTVSRYKNITRVDSPRTSAEEYEDLLVYQLKNFKSSKQGEKVERIVIFVDDLDRLSAEEMVSGLDAIRTFMEMPVEKLPQQVGLIFVVSCDEDRVADALAARSRTAGDYDLKNTMLVLGDARRFLDRIFQFRLEIAPFPKQDMRAFALKKLRDELKTLADDLEKRKVSLEDLVERMIPVSVQSPRNALHILNAFVQGWWLATQREAVAVEHQRGGLPKGAVTNYPLALAALCTLKVNFPDFYSDLQQEPSLIQYFTDIFIDKIGASSKDAFEQLPERTASILECYSDAETKSLRSMHWPLRQYLASLRALNWPPSLQPILAFSQDPMARKFGDKYERVYADLVSGNVPGVLDGLGYKDDTESISSEHGRQLYDWVEAILNHETQVRQDSAATVLATLAGRLPRDQARWILNPLAKRLASFPDLRWRIRIPTIRDVLEHARPDDRKEVVGKIIDELLFTEPRNIKTPDADNRWSEVEVAERVRDTVRLALWAKQKDNGNGLGGAHNAKLFQWLKHRSFSLQDKTVDLPFSDFEAWMTEYESDLLPSLGITYANTLAAELKADRIKEIAVEAALSRVRKVLTELEKDGAESQKNFWALLAEFLSVKTSAAVTMSLEVAQRNYENAPADEIQPFVQMLAERIDTTDLDDSQKLPDKKKATSVLLDMLETRSHDLDWDSLVGLPNEPANYLRSMLERWGSSEEDGESAVRLLNCVRQINPERADLFIQGWASRVLSDLSDHCRQWLAKEFATSLTVEQRAAIIESLKAVLNTSVPSMYDRRPDRFTRFETFMGMLPREAFKSAEMQKYLKELFDFVEKLPTEPSINSYVYKIVPTLPKLIEYAREAQVNRVLAKLFTGFTSDTHLYGFLHSQMADYWPDAMGNSGDYDPTRFFNDSHRIALEYASENSALSILTSMHRMVQRGIVDRQNTATVIETAYYLWPFHQEECLEVLLSYEQAPEAQRVADLMDSVEENEEEQLDRLSKAWSHMARYIEDDEAIKVARRILDKSHMDSKPDVYLQSWVSALVNRKALSLLSRLLSISELSDEKRERVWKAIEASSPNLNLNTVFEFLAAVLELEDNERTLHAVIESADRMISNLPQRLGLMKDAEVDQFIIEQRILMMLEEKLSSLPKPKQKKIKELLEKARKLQEEFDRAFQVRRSDEVYLPSPARKKSTRHWPVD
jgi:hypothetical protein